MAFEIIIGTYEQFLLGYNFDETMAELKQSFAVRSHTGSIKCINTVDRYIATGGSDDRIFVYDLKTRKEHCMLTQHTSSVTCVKFSPDHSHILSGSSDGTLAVVRVGNWKLEKFWEKAHKGGIVNIAVHSSGKLALTLGSDRSLHTWNLVKGRQAYVLNLMNKSKDPMNLELLMWGPCGDQFVLGGGTYTEIWSIEKGGLLKSIQHAFKVTSCNWYQENKMLVGYENGKLGKVDTKTGKVEVKLCHNSRVKSILVHAEYIIIGCSDGTVKVWNKKFREVTSCSTGCRITCMDVTVPYEIKQNQVEVQVSKKTKRNLENEESNNDISDDETQSKVVEEKHMKKKKNRKKK